MKVLNILLIAVAALCRICLAKLASHPFQSPVLTTHRFGIIEPEINLANISGVESFQRSTCAACSLCQRRRHLVSGEKINHTLIHSISPFPTVHLDRSKNRLYVVSSHGHESTIGHLESGVLGNRVVLEHHVELSAHRHNGVIRASIKGPIQAARRPA